MIVTLPRGVRMTAEILQQIVRECGLCDPCGDGTTVDCGGRNIPQSISLELTIWPPYPLMGIAPGGYLPTDWADGTYFGIETLGGNGHRFQNSTAYQLDYDDGVASGTGQGAWYLAGMTPTLAITDIPAECVYESSYSGVDEWEAYLAIVMLGCPGEAIHPDTLVLTPYWDLFGGTFLIKTSDDPDTTFGNPLVQFTDPDDPGITISSLVDGPGYERPRLWDIGFNNQYIFSVDETDFLTSLPVTRTIKVSW